MRTLLFQTPGQHSNAGRASLFVGAVSSGLIALTFVGQISHLGTALFVFSLVVIPTLVFMGLITFERVLQSGSADITYVRGINRIRHLYLEYAPQLQPYFMLSAYDDRGETLSHEAILTTKPNSTEWKEDKKNGHPMGYPYS